VLNASFHITVAHLADLPVESLAEVAFAGRSNAGKSSAINAIAMHRRLAFVSKMPGRTQHLNYFRVGEERYLVDLPGYGYARAPIAQKHTWQDLIGGYLHNRPQLRGLVLIMDIRHPFTDLDMQLLHWFQGTGKPVHILLSKADKLSRSQASATLHQVRKVLADEGLIGSAQLFSSPKQLGLEEAESLLRSWLDLPKATNSEPKTEKPKTDKPGKKKPGSRGIKAGRTEP
jgi:GTP-binding protein